MSVTDSNLIKLGGAFTGLTLYAVLYDSTGVAVSGNILTTFVEVGGGDYYWTYNAFPDMFQGYAKIYDLATGNYLTSVLLYVGTLIVQASQNAILANLTNAEIAALTDRALEIIERWLCRKLQLETFSEVYDGTGGSVFLRNYPVTEIQEISIRTCDEVVTYSAESGTDVPDGFVLNHITGEVRASFCSSTIVYFPHGFQNIEVTYSAGYATLPQSIIEATVQLAAFLYSLSLSDQTLKSETFREGYSYVNGDMTSDGYPKTIFDLISSYKRYSI